MRYKKSSYTDQAVILFCERNSYAKPYTMGMENLLLKQHGKDILEIERELINKKKKGGSDA